MFSKPVVKRTLLEQALELVKESKGIKSVFSTMKTNLENKNVQLEQKSEELSDAVFVLANAQEQIHQEAASNIKVINEITKIIE